MASRGKEIELLEHVGQVKPREDFTACRCTGGEKGLMSM